MHVAINLRKFGPGALFSGKRSAVHLHNGLSRLFWTHRLTLRPMDGDALGFETQSQYAKLPILDVRTPQRGSCRC